MIRRNRPAPRARLALIALLATAAVRLAAQGLPDRLTDADFWHMVTDFSEGDGYFRSENLLSNETGFQMVIPELLRTAPRGGVYVGVGPEQNFTYIAAIQPRVAFIIDIRHQNAVEHLLYKALFELSENRADFLSKLFSRPRPAWLTDSTPVDSLFIAYAGVAPDSMYYYRTLAAMKDRLMKVHAFAMTKSEEGMLEHVFDQFYQAGPDLSYTFGAPSYAPGRGMPTYAMLMVQTDNEGLHRSYLASEANFRTLRDLELRNMVVPVTGDFGGPKAIRTVGDYLRAHGATVSVFYCSNVEQYLFQDGIWFNFEKSVATMPLDSTSTFIRSGGGFRGGGYSRGGMGSSLLQSITELVKAVDAGRIQTYQDVLATSH